MPPEISRALGLYRLMAVVVGTMLLLLVCVAVPLRYGASEPALEQIVGPLHGALYIVYLVTCLELALRYRLGIPRMAGLICAGFVPFLAFVVERNTTAHLRAVAHDPATLAET